MGQLFCRVLLKTDQAVRLVVTKVGQAVRRVLTEMGQALKWVVTKVGQFFPPRRRSSSAMSRSVTRLLTTQMCGAITGLITKAATTLLTQMGQALASLLAKMVQAIIRSSTRRSYVRRSSRRPLIRIRTRSGVGSAGEPPISNQGSSGSQDHCSIDVNVVDNNDEHEAKASLATEDEGSSFADACGEDVAVGESWSTPEALLSLPYKEAVVKQGSPVKVNASPEGQVVKWGRVGMYGGWQRILLVGEGDFSFPACLAIAFGDASNMVATSLDTLDFLKKNYEKATDNIKELRSRGCKVIHKVDSTKMANHPKLCSSKFDRIIYNFPHAGFGKLKQSREAQISHHQALVLGFLENAKRMIEGDGQIHITHKCTGFSTKWNIDHLGKSKGLLPLKAVKFKLQTYPGYRTKYGYGGDKDFDCNPGKTYKFILPPEEKILQ